MRVCTSVGRLGELGIVETGVVAVDGEERRSRAAKSSAASSRMCSALIASAFF